MSTTQPNQWLDVDRNGLARLMEGRHPAFAVWELIQNAIDEDGVTTVTVGLAKLVNDRAMLSVQDDAPDGFHDLRHAYTLFAESKKKTDPTKRGRFNLGEKLVLAICNQASVTSTTGGVEFRADGTRRVTNAATATGSAFDGIVRMTPRQIEETIDDAQRLIVPPGITVTINGIPIEPRVPVFTFEAILPTLKEGPDGFRATERKTTVSLYEPRDGFRSAIYELGIPVVTTNDEWDVDVAQKVPLNMDRDNVTPGYLRKVRALVLNAAVDMLDAESATGTWVKDAFADPTTTSATIEKVLDARFGEKAVRYDPSDHEANKIAASQGYTVVHGGTFGGAEWDRIGETDRLPRAGAVTPSPRLVFVAGGTPPLSVDEWTPGMRRVAAYAKRLAVVLLGKEIAVMVHRLPFGEQILAAYSPGRLTFNLTKLGHNFFNEPDQAQIDALLIHEFAHDHCDDHFSHRFLDAACDLGAKMRAVDFTVEQFDAAVGAR